jgi:hypothetical protein
MEIIDNTDDATKQTAYAASIPFKLGFSPDTDVARAENEEIVKTILGEDVEQAQVPDEERWNHDTNDAPELFFEEPQIEERDVTLMHPYMMADVFYRGTGVSTHDQIQAAQRAAEMSITPSVASSISADFSMNGDGDEEWLVEWTTEDRAARLTDALKTQLAFEETHDDAQLVESGRGDSDAQNNTIDAENTAAATTSSTRARASALASLSPPDVQLPPAITTAAFILYDFSAVVKEFLVASRNDFDSMDQLYKLNFPNAVDFFGENNFTREPGQPRKVLRRDTYLFKSAQRAGLPGPIFRWLQGSPMDTEFYYPSAHLDSTIQKLTNQGIF